ncbi:GNAT family N-acetyltransferase [Corynebacterium sp. TAE3-ERU2]|uniref:GNAT family N-acetyltransferase n=1 Tax=Corynebacterium sp. TAE3-ERU2 TaxID=2849497 RepID=UPI001C44F138|nr:GNAT family N-acetyltransferase [Corynebacterium sp. TAE3-ERU2]MBV7302966.1 GNAT family N-acetyltransferase [Corynebacterium sp. TAE3-ERU2]
MSPHSAPAAQPSRGADSTAAWDADVILYDGSVATVRAVRDSDRPLLVEFYTRVSDASKYLRFFSAHPTLSESDLDSWVQVDHRDTVTLVLTMREQIIATAHYGVVDKLLPQRVADVSFLVQDDAQGKGAANILLEHLAQAGRDNKVERFFAEMLTQNRAMVHVFRRAGYEVRPELEDGFITVDFQIDPTDRSREVMLQREQKSEAAAISRLLRPRSVAVVGDSDRMQAFISRIFSSHFRGQVHVSTGPVHAPAPAAEDPAPAAPAAPAAPELLAAIPGPIDLVVAHYEQESFDALLATAAAKEATGIVVLARGENPSLSSADAHHVLSAARARGIRALGPASLGLINTDPKVSLNATPAPLPQRGPVGLFTQSAGVATLALARAVELNIGISSFLASGAFADVTGNDVIQYWSADEATSIALLSLDAIGNPRKFFRLLRRLAVDKHVVVFSPSRALRSALPAAAAHDSAAQDSEVHAPAAAFDEVIRRTGAMVVSRRDTMFDIARILSSQPAPGGRRVTVISNSAGLSEQMAQAAGRFGLVAEAVTVRGEPVAGLVAATAEALRSDCDAVLCAAVEISEPIIAPVLPQLHALAADAAIPLLAAVVGFDERLAHLSAETGCSGVPLFRNYADALEALGVIVETAEVKAKQRYEQPDSAGFDRGRATAVIERALAAAPEGGALSDEDCAELLSCYGIELVRWEPARTVDEAHSAAEGFGWNVVLKATAAQVRGRPELHTIHRAINDFASLRRAWDALGQLGVELGLAATAEEAVQALHPVVQPTVSTGTAVNVRGIENPVLGPMISLGLTSAAAVLNEDRRWCTPPLSETEARAMITHLATAPLLTGYRGTEAADLDALQRIIVQLAQLKDDLASVAEIELTPVIASPHGAQVVGARVVVQPQSRSRDPLIRAM